MLPDNLLIGILAASLVIFIIIVSLVLVILSNRKQRLKQALKEANYQRRLNDVNFAALRSQMNPHFIFNCLNSIKLYTEQNNTDAASEYLSKFAQLIRNTLDNARREKVVLSEDIESIQLYLELEAMRFKQKLVYTIEVDKNVDSEFIELPPMIIQPYIENAVWHGLMQKEAGGEIRLHFSQVENDSLLRITIADNGIGRARAAALKDSANVTHQSHGTRITGERLDLINEKYEGTAEVDIQDLYDAHGEPAGTLVTLQLPIK